MPHEVKVRLVVDGTPEAIAAFRAANAGAQQFAKGSNASFRALHGTLAAIKTTLAAIGLAVGVTQVLAFGAAVVRTAREAGDTAKSLGTTASRLSALNAVTDLGNEKQEVMAAGLARLGSNLDALKRGEPSATAAFRRLGLGAADFPSDDVAVAAEVVARALARMRDGSTKSAAAADVLGQKIGRRLIPVFQKLVDIGGLDGAIGYARRTGQLVDNATVATLEQLTESLKRIKLEASSAALEFVKGFGPEVVALINQLSQAFDPQGVSALQTWGSTAGKALRIVTADLRIAWTYAGSLIERLARGSKLMALAAPGPAEPGRSMTTQEAADRLARQRQIQAGLQEQKDTRETARARILAIQAEMVDESEIKVAQLRRDQQSDDEAYSDNLMRLNAYLRERGNRIRTETFAMVVARQNIIAALETGPMGTEDSARVAALRREIEQLRKEEKQRLAAPPPDRTRGTTTAAVAGATTAQLKEADQAALQAAQAHSAAVEAKAKEAYDAGLTSLQAYYTARRDTIRENEAAELTLLTAEWERAQKITDPAQRKAALEAIDARTQELLQKADKQRTELDARYKDERVALEKTLTEISDKRRAAEEQEHQTKLREIAEIQRVEAESLFRLGAPRETADAQAAADAEVLRRAEDFRHQLATARTELETLTGAGVLSDEDLKRFLELADVLEKAAAAIGPEAVKNAKEFKEGVLGMQSGHRLTAEMLEGSKAAFVGWARTAADSYDTVGEAALGMARNVVNALYEIAAAATASTIWDWLGKLLPGKKKGGKIQARATGGLLHGPGTGTSDSILLRGSKGEHIQPAARVAEPGALPFLETMRLFGFQAALRRALAGPVPQMSTGGLVSTQSPPPAAYQLRIPNHGSYYLRRYAEGGLVQAPRTVTAQAELGGQLTIVVPPGVDATFDGPAGVKKLVRIVNENQKAFRKAQGLG